jgi:hypothetical protein
MTKRRRTPSEETLITARSAIGTLIGTETKNQERDPLSLTPLYAAHAELTSILGVPKPPRKRNTKPAEPATE